MNKQDTQMTVVISSDTFGEGPKELGKILLKNYIYTLTELEALPNAIIFLNSGAFMTSQESGVLEDLENLQSRGVEILTCGSCIDYYNLQNKLAVGKITTMYNIAEIMSTASKLININ